MAAEGATRQLAGLQAALAQAQAEASNATQQARTATDTQAILQVPGVEQGGRCSARSR